MIRTGVRPKGTTVSQNIAYRGIRQVNSKPPAAKRVQRRSLKSKEHLPDAIATEQFWKETTTRDVRRKGGGYSRYAARSGPL